MSSIFNPCLVIPCYNHANFLAGIIGSLEQYHLPIIIINDGCNDEDADILKQLTVDYSDRYLLTLPENQGKGIAVMMGFKEAYRQGFTHALQVDADGQHAMEDIPKFISRAKENPSSLISGAPIYDASIPKSRLYSRYITHFWVWIETLSFSIIDSMCGFRVYPLKETIQLLNNNYIGHYMDFDTEIMVKLYWQNVPIIFIKTQVIYPEVGVSNFRMFKDNLRISWMHTRLFFGMLIRCPVLLWRKIVK